MEGWSAKKGVEVRAQDHRVKRSEWGVGLQGGKTPLDRKFSEFW